jgi:hypothetical protein
LSPWKIADFVRQKIDEQAGTQWELATERKRHVHNAGDHRGFGQHDDEPAGCEIVLSSAAHELRDPSSLDYVPEQVASVVSGEWAFDGS